MSFYLVSDISADMSSDREQTQRRRSELREQFLTLSLTPLMRGSLVERMRRCGRANCACAHDRRRRHAGSYLTVQLDGRSHSLHVRPEDRERVHAAIDAYRRLWDLINELTACELSDLKREARERGRARRRRRSGERAKA